MNKVLAGQLIGKQLDEYRLEGLLGRGGMAQVYKAFDVNLKRWAAVKVIDAPFRTDATYIARFEREAKAIAQLRHQFIVQLYRYGQVGQLLYMAMEYIDGQDLEAVLAPYRAKRQPFPDAKAVPIIRQICAALDYAHRKGVIHRDIKPANIVLDASGEAILTDFGLVLLDDRRTQGLAFGTPHYIAPEQAISSANAVPQSDLYAVGVILYEMLTGQWPFDAPHPYDLAMLHLDEPPPLPRSINPDLSLDVERVILKSLVKDPDQRYQTGAALADALEQALNKSASQPVKTVTTSQLKASLVGTRVGQCIITEQINEGFTVSVFKGRHERLKRDVAVKILFTRLPDHPNLMEYFQRHTQVIMGLKHPYILKVHEFNIHDGRHYWVMDYVTDGTLAAWLNKQAQRGKKVSLPGVFRIVNCIASALDYAHAQGIIHGNLRPANVMLTSKGQVTLADLGLVQLLYALDQTRLGSTLRSPAYTSPEQIKGDMGNKYSDIYALGVILHQLLTGRVPFEADSPFDVLKMHRYEPVPSPLSSTEVAEVTGVATPS